VARKTKRQIEAQGADKSPEIEAVYKGLSVDEEVRMVYDARIKAIMDEQARLDGAYEEGFAEGFAEGREKGRIARAMLAEAMSLDLISEITGLSIQEINSLNQQ
jgi:predicted transposase/invertase (TIGR01784 family)